MNDSPLIVGGRVLCHRKKWGCPTTATLSRSRSDDWGSNHGRLGGSRALPRHLSRNRAV